MAAVTSVASQQFGREGRVGRSRGVVREGGEGGGGGGGGIRQLVLWHQTRDLIVVEGITLS